MLGSMLVVIGQSLSPRNIFDLTEEENLLFGHTRNPVPSESNNKNKLQLQQWQQQQNI